MSTRVKDKAKVPPGGVFPYVNPEDGWRIESHAYNVLRDKAKAYRQINNYPIGLQWDEEFEKNVCQNLPQDCCFEWEAPSPARRARQFATALINFAKQGFKVRTEAEVLEIKAICETCTFYNGTRGMFKIACGRCGCSSKKFYLKSEHCPLSPPKWT